LKLASAAAPGLIASSENRGAARPVLDAQLMLAVAAVAAGAVLLLAVVWVVQRHLIYFPLQQDVPPVATALPRASEVNFETDDGLRLGGWFLPAVGGRKQRDRARIQRQRRRPLVPGAACG
jgi:hypothetical protein